MVATTKIAGAAKEVLLTPIYLYQGYKVKRDTVRLPEPEGERHGRVKLTDAACQTKTGNDRTLSVMVVGDSAAAGVGSQTQQEALAGQLVPALQQQASDNQAFAQQFATLSWSVQATTGHTSFDILRRLYVIPKPSQPLDVMVISVGVNDTTAQVTAAEWQQRLEAIITIAQRKLIN